MKRTAFVTLLFGIALLVVPAAQAHVMADDSAGGGSVVLSNDSAGGGTVVLSSDSAAGGAVVRSDDAAGGGAVVLQVDKLGGSGESKPVPIRPDVLGGSGEPSVSVWLQNELGKDAQQTQPVLVSSDDSFAWGPALGVTLFVAMLLALAATATLRRRHRLSF